MAVMENQASFIVTINLTYHPFRVPPRCRKARQVIEVEQHWVRIPVVTLDEAPVAARIPNSSFMKSDDPVHDRVLRTWNGKLYSPVRERQWEDDSPTMIAGSKEFPAEVRRETGTPHLPVAIQEVEEGFSGKLIIEGEVWAVADEPTYWINTMGLGANHGGTTLSIDAGRSNMGASRLFSLTEHDVAVEEAVKVALQRGDTKSVDHIRSTRPATILIPSAFKHPTRASRIAKAENDVAALLAQVTEAVSGTVTIDRLRAVADLIDSAKERMYENGLESVKVG